MRCPSCNLFVPFDTEVDPEAEEPEVRDGTVSLSVRRVLACEQCGEELKDATLELEWPDALGLGTLGGQEHGAGCPAADEESDVDPDEAWDIDLDVVPTTRMQTTDRHGKPIKRARYMRTFYGVSATGAATCHHCGLVVELAEAEAEEQASGYEELT